MGVYLYCVLPDDAPDPGITGLDGTLLRAVRAAGASVWVADVPAVPRPDLSRIRAHDRVIRSAMDAGLSPVPIRFGQVLPDDDALRAHLAEHDYPPILDRVAGAVEFGIRILDPDQPADHPTRHDGGGSAEAGSGTEPGTGAAYLRALAERIHETESRQARSMDAATEIDDRLRPWVRDRRMDASDRPPGAVVAHLVQADAADAYVTRARELAGGYPPLRIVVTGPWPPYSFVDR